MRASYDPKTSDYRTLADLETWHGIDTEPVIEPDLPIVDTHHHLWKRPHGDYRRVDALKDMASGHHIVATVFVQCSAEYRPDGPVEMRPLGETEFVLSETADGGTTGGPALCAAIVGNADLMLGDRVKAVLEAQIEVGRGRFCGIRSLLRSDPYGIGMLDKPYPPGAALSPQFRAGFAHLAPLGLSYDAWMFHHQLGDLADLASAFPNTKIIVNHVGGPLGTGPYAARRTEVFETWKKSLARIAEYPNVMMKLGGLGMLYFGFEFYKEQKAPGSLELAEAWRPYVSECIEAFGVDRCMFESNFPGDKQTASYRVLWNTFKRLTMGASEAEKLALFALTGADAYRIDLGNLR